MKKLSFLTGMILFSVISVFGQSSNVVSAWNYMKYGQFEEARNSIDQATQDSKTSTWPKTWFYRGSIYLAIYDDTTFRKKYPNSLKEAITSYEKAMDINPKNEFKDQIQAGLQECALNAFNEGVGPYNTKDYQKAYDAFKQSAEVYNYINKTFNQNYVDTLATLYGANSATKLKNYDEATRLYQSLLDKGIYKPEIYANLGEIYLAQGDTTKAINALSQGKEKFPSDKGLMVQELNAYL